MIVQLSERTVGISVERMLILISVHADGPTSPHPSAVPLPARRPAPLQKWRMKAVVDYVDSHLTSRITLARMATAAGLSRMYFAAQFRAATGMRPHDYVLQRRINRAQELLRDGKLTLVEVALGVGFQSQSHFSTVFKRLVGKTPHRWRHLPPDRKALESSIEPHQPVQGMAST